MKFGSFKAVNPDKNLKCAIHKTGRLGFTEMSIKKLDIENKRFINIGQNLDDENDKDIYMVVKATEDEFSFKTNKAGGYYYANTKELFDMLKLDYVNMTIIYDIIDTNEMDQDGNKYYRLKRREKERK